MEIGRWIKHPLHTVKPLDTIQHAREIMDAHRINQLPVVVDGRLVGIITDRDLREAFPSVFESAGFDASKRHGSADPALITVESVMTATVLTLTSRDSLVDAAKLMRQERIAAVPILEEGGRLAGLLTRSDVLDAFIKIQNGHEPSKKE